MFLEDVSELSRGSGKRVLVKCDSEQAEYCLGEVMRKYRDVCNNMDKNSGKYICLQCSIFQHRGRNHYRCKYKKLDDHFMDIIDSEEKAYLLGWIASDGTLSANNVIIRINTCDARLLETLRDFICPDLPVSNYKKGVMKKLCISSTQWCESIQKHLNLKFEKGRSHKKSHLVQMPVDIFDSLKWIFLRGLFEGDGCIRKEPTKYWSSNLCVNIGSQSLGMKMQIVTFCKASYINICMDLKSVRLSGQYAARFLEKIYFECNEKLVLERKYGTYKQLKLELSRFWDRAAVAEKAYVRLTAVVLN